MAKGEDFEVIAERLNRLSIGPTLLEVLGASLGACDLQVLESAVASCEKRERKYWRAALEWFGVCLSVSRKTEARLVNASEHLERKYLEKILSKGA